MDWQGWLNDFAVWLPPLPAIPQPPWWLSWLAGGMSISTTILLRKLKLSGWWCMITNQFNWGWLAAAARQHGLIVSTLFYVYLGVAGLRAWLKDPPIKTSESTNTRNEKTSEPGYEIARCVHCGGSGSGAPSAESPEDDTGASQHDK